MRYSPVELRHVKIGRRVVGGYSRSETDALLEDVVASFEEVWRERGELADKLEDVERVLAEVKQRESLLASTLVAAEKASDELRAAAKREAEVIVAEAHHEARSVTRAAQGERERLFAEVRRVETLLRAALGMVEETNLPAAPPEASQQWPRREDTREFQAVSLPEVAETKVPTMQPVPDEPDEESGEDRDFAWG
ncbi:MAG: DivIVA domain-containing protein [Gaiellaceae bacterium]